MINSDLERAKKLLTDGDYTCIICNNYKTYTSTQRGVSPLFTWYTEGVNFSGFCGADKVIGKATAFLYVLLNIKAVYANVISKSALKVFNEYNINIEYTTLVDFIINRKGDGICPFECAVMEVSDPEEAFKAIKKKREELNIK